MCVHLFKRQSASLCSEKATFFGVKFFFLRHLFKLFYLWLQTPVCEVTPGRFNILCCLVSPSGNPKKHITALKKAVDTVCVGEPSLYNSLNLAIQSLKYVLQCLCFRLASVILLNVTQLRLVFVWRHMPGHTSREILIILSSLTTCDPANIYELIKVKSHPYLGVHSH